MVARGPHVAERDRKQEDRSAEGGRRGQGQVKPTKGHSDGKSQRSGCEDLIHGHELRVREALQLF